MANKYCNDCKEILMKQLCQIPSAWRAQIAEAICNSIGGGSSTPTADTLTVLSSFETFDSLENLNVCIKYTDEVGVTVNRCFSFSGMLNARLNQLDPACIATQDEWYGMSDVQKLQAIIDKLCTACFTTDIITTTSTTTTTTQAPNVPTTTTSTTSTTTLPVIWPLSYNGASAVSDIVESDILAGIQQRLNPAGMITFNWTSFNENPAYGWFAVPAGNAKTHYEAVGTPLNNGSVGQEGDLFGPYNVIYVNGAAYWLYVTGFPTQFTEGIKLT